ncbi:MAG: class III cytochrome C family protein [Bacteroidetes bacterium]|nr:class III cytochrome C family protein [Bacteroidota bacterium]
MKNFIVIGSIGIIIWLMIQFPHVMLGPGELVAAHQEIKNKCAACHEPFWGISNEKCISCHKLSEIGKDTIGVLIDSTIDTKILFHHKLVNQECTSCHTDHQGIKPSAKLSNFQHEFLDKSIISNCKSCHVQPVDKLHLLVPSTCVSCHSIQGWNINITFKHEMILASDRNKCESCHKKPIDNLHDSFTTSCNKCHTTSKWVPSTFDHSSYFRLDRNHNVKCNTCHTNNNFSNYSCYGCHEHSQNKIIQEHNEEGIYNITNCASCHKSADEDAIRMNGNSRKEMNGDEIRKVDKYIKEMEKENE